MSSYKKVVSGALDKITVKFWWDFGSITIIISGDNLFMSSFKRLVSVTFGRITLNVNNLFMSSFKRLISVALVRIMVQ